METHSPQQLSLAEARRRLGLSAADQAAPYLPQWKEAEAEILRQLAGERDPDRQIQLQRDLAALREVISTLEKEPPVPALRAGVIWWSGLTAALVLFLLFAWVRWGAAFDPVEANRVMAEERKGVEELLASGRWEEAEGRISALRKAGVSKAWARQMRAQLKQKRIVVSGQELGYAVGEAQAALEAGRLEEAKELLDEARALGASAVQLEAITREVAAAALTQKKERLINGVGKAISARNWERASRQIESLSRLEVPATLIEELASRMDRAREQWEKDRQRAQQLYLQALELDDGTYRGEALSFLEEARSLDSDPEIQALYEKMAAYGRTLQVPEEFKTIGEALAEARARDRIQVGAGTFVESITVQPGQVIVGAGKDHTIVEFPAEEGPVLQTSNGASGLARVRGLTLRHAGLVSATERFSALVVSAGTLRLEDSRVEQAAGHGVAVTAGAEVILASCEVLRSGWDGVSVSGQGAQARLLEVTSTGNYHHGVDFWDGGSGSVEGGELSGNGRAGLVIFSPEAPVTARRVLLSKNRELGVLIADAQEVIVENCRVRGNALGGIIVQEEAASVSLLGNKVRMNGEVGIAVEQGSKVRLIGNEVTENQGRQLWEDAVFPEILQVEGVTPPAPAPAEE